MKVMKTTFSVTKKKKKKMMTMKMMNRMKKKVNKFFDSDRSIRFIVVTEILIYYLKYFIITAIYL